MSEELRTLRAYRALIKARLDCGCLMTEKDCGLHGPRDVADIMLVSCIFMSEHIRHYGVPVSITSQKPAPLPYPTDRLDIPHCGSWRELSRQPAEVWWWCHNNNASLQHGELNETTTFSICLLGDIPGPNTFHADTPKLVMEKAKARLEQLAKGEPSPHEERAQLLGASPPAVTDDRPRCNSCHCYMTPSKAIPEAVVNMGEGQYSGGSHVGHAPLVDVWKCPECGHSFWAAAPPAPRAEWKPRFKVGEEVRIKVTGHKATITTARHESRSYLLDRSGFPWREDELEPAPWKLPEPPSVPRQALDHAQRLTMAEQERDAALAQASEAEKRMEAAELSLTIANGRFLGAEDEIRSLRASVPLWVPIESRKPTRQDADEECQVLAISMKSQHPGRTIGNIHFKNVVLGSGKTHWCKISVPPLPVETEEGDGFHAWAEQNGFLHQGNVTVAARCAWQAALRSKSTEAQA